MTYRLETFSDPQFRRLAGSRNGTIRINRLVTPEILLGYFQGEIESATSRQKKQVLGRLQTLGWTLSKIRELTATSRATKRFLILHEISHLKHNDQAEYPTATDERRLEIEVRACIQALAQLQKEALRQPCPN